MSRTRCIHAIVLILWVLYPLFVLSQSNTGITLRSKTELVEVPVVVTRGGIPVRGLSAEQFVLTSDGEPERISIFREVEVPDPQIDCGSEHIARNRPPVVGETVILVIDLLNARSMTKLRTSTIAVLKETANKQVPVTVLALGRTGLVELQGVCAPRPRLESIIAVLGGGDKAPADSTRDTRFSAEVMDVIHDLNNKNVPSHNFGLVRRVDFRETTFLAVEEIVRAFGTLDGRKKLIWIAQEVPAYLQPLEAADTRKANLEPYKNTFRLLAAEERRPSAHPERAERWRRSLILWNRLNDANFRVMPILDEVPGIGTDLRIPSISAVPMPGSSAAQLCEDTVNYSPDAKLAERIPDVCYNDAGGCIQKALKDRNYYLLGFYLKRNTKSGVHRLGIRVSDKSSKVFSRQGFLVIGDQFAHATDTQAPSNNAFDSPSLEKSPLSWTFLTAPLDAADIALSVEWTRTASQAGHTTIGYKLRAGPNDISVSPQNLSVNLRVATFAQHSGEGSPEFHERAFTQVVSAEQQELVLHGFLLEGNVTVKDRTDFVRFILRDDNTGRVGTVTVRLDSYR